MKWFNILMVFCLFLNSSCATGLMKVKYLEGYNSLQLQRINYTEENKNEILNKIQSLRAKLHTYTKPLSVNNYDEIISEIAPIIEEVKTYKMSKEIFSGDKYLLILPAKSEVTLDMDTYCLSPHNAAPANDEPFQLTNEDPKIPLYSEIMSYTNRKAEINKGLKQNLFWNLKNEVKFENLPIEQQNLLLQIDPYSPLKLNNFIKEQFMKQAGNLLDKYIPQIGEAKDVVNLIKGKVYEYEDYARRIESLKSKYKKTENTNPINAEGYDNIATIVKPSGFSHAKVTFINTSDKTQSINSFFKPIRKDVQPLGFDIPNAEDFYDAFKEGFGELLSDIIDLIGFDLGPGDELSIENNPEKLLDLLKAYRDRIKAFDRTEKEFGYIGKDDISDAFRHAFWNSLMVRDVGYDFAKEIADNHELNFDNNKSRDMDLWNNKIGRDIGQRLKDNGNMDDDTYAEEILNNKDRLKKLR